MARLEFARGTVYERYIWEQNALVGVRRVDAPGGTPFFQTPDGALVSYSIQSGKTARLDVERGSDGQPRALVGAGSPPIRAGR